MVWGRFVRAAHWSLALAAAAAWLSTLRFVRWHEAAGYAALGIACARIAWGFVGPAGTERFGRWPLAQQAAWRYARDVAAGRAHRHVGHNPLGAWMAIALLACILALGLTGWLYTTDAFWGMAWLDWLHHALAWLLLALVAVHVAGAVFTGWRHGENLVWSMITGRKRPAAGDDVA